ncbi:glycerophosphodiester phosphodiesterase family protein [Actinomadura sp. NBRC 104425]|uniref:glycerophosphodiester phosphodiesterase n=1 Tax=Actinomadura sp. NBRC 104425 TaxID=3032204 RepID=UPI00255401D8|nr:glycerophosphodiester phosphodiesterase family protein [Actinomadura sp. NBRC 104425]
MFRRLGLTLAAAVAATLVTGTATDAAASTSTPGKVTVVAHRGASAYAPENTIAAFKLARKQRADMFELDVQETKDHKLVVIHDTTLARTTNVEEVYPDRAPWRVADFTLAEIRKLDAGSWFSAEYTGERIPTLGESLRAMRHSGIGLLLEVKSPELYPGIEKRIADELKRNPSWLLPDPRERRLVVQSFNWESMERFSEIMPRVPIGLLGTPAVEQLPVLAAYADQINPQYTALTSAYVKRVHALGMEVFTWTVDDPAAMRNVIKLGVNGIITDKPDVLRQVVTGGARERAAA